MSFMASDEHECPGCNVMVRTIDLSRHLAQCTMYHLRCQIAAKNDRTGKKDRSAAAVSMFGRYYGTPTRSSF